MRLIKYFSFLISCFSMSILLTACGSKGDLYQVNEPNSVDKTVVEDSQLSTQELKKKQP
ncbi:lipoprotein [Colwellia maritima]